jgi:hypothetical protein
MVCSSLLPCYIIIYLYDFSKIFNVHIILTSSFKTYNQNLTGSKDVLDADITKQVLYMFYP